MASGTHRAKKRGMDQEEIEELMQECSILLEESKPARSTPNPRPSVSGPDEDETLQ